MNDPLQKLLRPLTTLRIREDRRRTMRDELLAYADFHPVRVGEDSRLSGRARKDTLLFSLFSRNHHNHMTAGILIAALIAVGGGTSYAAEGAVPGDVLYPIKVEVNEEVRAAFAFSAASEAALQADLVRERLEEAHALAAEGRLDAETSAAIQTRVQEHYTDASTAASALETSGDLHVAAEVQSALKATLDTYAEVFADNALESSNTGARGIVTILAGFRTDTTAAQATTSAAVNAESDSEVRATIDAAGRTIGAVQAKLAKHDGSVEVQARVTQALQTALEAHADAQVAFDAGAYAEAYTQAQVALEAAARATLSLSLTGDTAIMAPSNESTNDTTAPAPTEKTFTATTSSDNNEEVSTENDTEVEVETDATVDVDADDTDIKVDANLKVDAAGTLSL